MTVPTVTEKIIPGKCFFFFVLVKQWSWTIVIYKLKKSYFGMGGIHVQQVV